MEVFGNLVEEPVGTVVEPAGSFVVVAAGTVDSLVVERLDTAVVADTVDILLVVDSLAVVDSPVVLDNPAVVDNPVVADSLHLEVDILRHYHKDSTFLGV